MGSQNVQIGYASPGSTITVTIRSGPRVRLPLSLAEVPVGPTVRSPSRLLRARAGVVPFVDRPAVMATTAEWLASSDAFSALLVGGSAGTGKTRLGIQLCADVSGDDWVAGLMTEQTTEQQIAALADLEAPRLVVIDYAETRTEQLGVVLPYLAELATTKSPVRVLLLVRAAPRDGDWTEQLRATEELDLVLDETDVLELEQAPLSEQERLDLFQGAAKEFARRASKEIDVQPAADRDRRGASTFDTPLLVAMAAYLAVHDSDRQVPTSRAELLHEVARHEAKYWRRSLEARQVTVPSPQLQARIVALATLAGADTEDEAADLLRLLPELTGATGERRYELAGWVRHLYPGDRWWNPVEPDLLGEHLVATVLAALPAVLAGVLDRDRPAALVHSLDVLTRALPNHPALADGLRPVLDDRFVALCQLAKDQAVNEPELRLLLGAATVADALARLIPLASPARALLWSGTSMFPAGANLITGPLALAISAELVNQCHQLAKADPASHNPSLAMSLSNLSVRLADAGQRDEAMNTIQEAVTIRRQLAQVDPAAHEPYLATSLNNLSIRLGEVGRRDEALNAIQEAVTIRRRLAKADPAANEPGLAMSLINLSSELGEIGRRDEAMNTIQEAVTIRRRLAKADPAANEPDLAGSLNNLSLRLGDVGRGEEALSAIQEATTIYRRLAKADPAAHEPGLAMSLNNLASELGKAGRREEALTAVHDAVKIDRRRAKKDPVAYESLLATSLNNLSLRLGEVGRRDEALSAIQEATTIYRRLAEADPAANESNLERSLYNLSVLLSEAGRDDEVLTVQVAVDDDRRLAKAHPADCEPASKESLRISPNLHGETETPG